MLLTRGRGASRPAGCCPGSPGDRGALTENRPARGWPVHAGRGVAKLSVGAGWRVGVGPFFVAGGAVIGGTTLGIAGALDSVPEEKAKQTEETVDNALVKLDVQETMAEQIYRAGSNLTDYEYTIFKGIGPTTQEEISDYRTLNLKGINI